MTNNKYFNMGVKIAMDTASDTSARPKLKPSQQNSFTPANAANMLDADRGLFADYAFGGFLPSNRTNTANTLAEAAGINPGFTVKHPFISQLMGSITGMHLLPTLLRRRNIARIQNSLRNNTFTPPQVQPVDPSTLPKTFLGSGGSVSPEHRKLMTLLAALHA